MSLYFSLTVMAYDDGTPRLDGRTTVLVNITDVNNKEPVFLKPIYDAHIMENSGIGDFVLQVGFLPINLNIYCLFIHTF